jgi:serine/threonine-protein kinase
MRKSAPAPEKTAPDDQESVEESSSEDAKASDKSESDDDNAQDAEASEDDGWIQTKVKLEGTLLSERYAVESQLGSGGMGAVYLAQHVDLQKQVAIKVLHGEFASKSELVQRFLQEAQAASRIRHENVIDITDFGKTPGGLAFFVMEYLEGTDLAGALAKDRLPWIRTEWIFMQVCDALRAAHNKGIVHRDLKPANIFLLDRGGPDYVKLLDFGIAKLTDAGETGEKLTRTGTLFGTPQYMSPEQAAGRGVDTRTDVYAMGCILFEMITGRVPYEGDNFMHTLYLHLNEDLPELGDAVAGCGAPTAITAIVHRALAKKPDERFQTIDELLGMIMAVSTTTPAPILRSGRAITAPYEFGDEESEDGATAKPSGQATKIDAPSKATKLGTDAFVRDGLGALQKSTPPPADAVVTPTETTSTPPKTLPKWPLAVGALVICVAAYAMSRSSDKAPATETTPAVVPEVLEPTTESTTPPTTPPTIPPATQQVEVDTHPTGATVFHGDDAFPTPATLHIPTGASWSLRIEKTGFRTVSMNTVMGQPKLVVELIPEVKAVPLAPTAPTTTTKIKKPTTNKTKAKVKQPKLDTPKTDPKRPSTDNPDPWGN